MKNILAKTVVFGAADVKNPLKLGGIAQSHSMNG
jgi:hypothetical protein